MDPLLITLIVMAATVLLFCAWCLGHARGHKQGYDAGYQNGSWEVTKQLFNPEGHPQDKGGSN